MNTNKFPRSRYLSAAVSAALSFAAATAHAGPQNGVVTNGAATISAPNTNVTQIDQTTNSVSIDWQTFDVAANESVNFNQPSANAVALNRILTQDPSQILGSINANGRLFLLNPNGIIFGASARVNVGSLVASSLDLTDADAATGRYSFATAAERSGAIVNDGVITAGSGGSITLLGGSILNNGLILADYGTVNLGAGRAATLSFDGDGLMRFQIDAGLLTDANGVSAAVTNSGEIAAAGGQVLLTAQQAGDVVAQAVNNEGVIRASRIENVGGVVRLVGTGGSVVNGGTLDATGSGAGTGGTVHVLGERVELSGTASIDVSGNSGGGTALIGGGFRGEDSAIANAQQTTVANGAVIRADSTTRGDAGQVVIWSDGTTRFHGEISARALGSSGDGGNVEVSGREHLGITGHAWLDSANGKSGRLLLDPGALTIVDDDDPDPPQSTGVLDTVNDGWVNAQLVTGSLDIVTTPSANPSVDEDLTVEADAEITWADVGNTLRLEGGDSIAIDGIINGAGPLTLVSGGTIALGGNISVGGALNVTAGANITQSSAVSVTGAANFTTAGGSSILLGNSANAFAGNVTFAASSGTLQNVTLANSTAIDLQALSIAGNLNVTAASGSITQAGALSVGGTSTFTADAGQSITLGEANTFTGAVSFVGDGGNLNNVTVRDLTALTLQPLSVDSNLSATALSINAQALAVGGTLALTATSGGISQSAAMNVTGNSTFTASAGQSVALDENNAFLGSVAFVAGSGNLANVTIRDTTALDLQALTIGGNLVATGSVLTQSGGLSVAQASTFRANQGTALVLDNPGNALQGPVQFLSNGPGALQSVTLRNSIATDLGASTVADAFNIRATSGNITQSGELSVGGIATFTAGTGQSIDLDDTGNSFSGAVNFVGDGGPLANVTVVDTTALTLQAMGITGSLSATAASIDSLALTVGANLDLIATTGGISQTGALNVTGNSTFTADAGQSILLGQANAFNGTVTFAGAGGNLDDVTVRDSSAFDLQALSLDGDLSVTTTAGAITQSGALAVGGTSSFTAAVGQSIALADPANDFTGAVTFTGSGGNLATVSVRDSSALTLGALALSGDLTVNAASIAQTGVLVIGGNSSFTAAGGQSIDLDTAGNTFTGTVGFAARSGTLQDVAITDSTALDLQAMTISGDLTAVGASLTQSGALSVGGTATLTSGTGMALNTTSAAALTVNAAGTVTQSGALTITGGTTINASGQSITLTNAGNSFGGAIAATAASASLTNSGVTTLAASTLGTSLTVNSTGAINQTGAINVVGGGTVLSSNAGVALNTINTGTLTVSAGGAVTQTNALAVAGSTTINAAGQNVTLNSTTNAFTGEVGIVATNATLTNSLDTTLAGTTAGSGLTVNSTGAITQSGVLSVTGTSTFNAAGQSVTLTNPANTLGGIAVTAANASLTNSGATMLLASTLDNSLTVNSTGTVTQSGALTVGGATTIAAASQAVTLSNPVNAFAGGVAVTGANVALNNAGSLDLRASVVSGNLTVASGTGTISQSGALNVAGSSTFTAAGGQSILLTNAANAFGGGVSLASSGTLDNVSLAAASNLTLQGLSIAGDLNATSGGDLTQSGALAVGGNADFRTLNAGGDVTLTGANQLGSVSATSAGSVSITQGTGDMNLRQVSGAGPVRLEASAGSIVDDAADASAATVSSTVGVELVARDNIGTVTDLLSRQGTAIAVSTNGGSLAARVTDVNGQINLALPGGSAPTAAAGAISAGGSGRLLIQSAGDLSLNAFNSAVTGFDEIGFSADGTLSVPGSQSDLIAGPLATLYLRGGVDIARPDRTFNLSASHLIFDSASQGGDVTLNTAADRIDASVGSGASLTVQDSSDLTLGTLNAGNNVTIRATSIRDDGDAGSVTRVSAGGAISFDASAGIGDADGVGGGRIDTAANAVSVNASAGSVYLTHAGDLQISGEAASGAIDVVAPTGNVTVTSTLRANGPLTLVAGTAGSVAGNITLTGTAQSAGSASLTAANGGVIADANDPATHLVAQSANLTAASVGSQANTLGVEVGALSASAGGDLYVSALNGVQVRTITATAVGISATSAITDDGDNATGITAQSLTLAGTSIGASGVGSEIDTTVDRLSASASAGGIYIGESGDLQLAALSASGTGNSIVVRAEGAITDDGDTTTRVNGGSLALTGTSIGAAGAAIETQVVLLNATASSGGVFVNEADDLQINTVTGTDVSLTAAGALIDDGNDSTRVTGTSISLNAARIGATDNRIDTAAGSLNAIATAGGIHAAEQDDVALGEIRASGTGNTVDIRTGGNGNMSVQTLVTQGGAVNLTAGGTGSITVTGAIESNNGVVSLISGNALALPGLDTGTGSVTLRTVNDLNVGTISASSVSITSDTGNVSLGTIDATGGTVTVSANNGTITDGNDTSLTARDATLTARSIGGPDQALNLAVDNLTATASAGGIYINDIDGLTLNAVNAAGTVSIVTTGALTQAAGIASGGNDIEVFAASILMQAGATTLSGNGNISYVANTGTASLEVLDAGTGRTLVIAADSVYSTLGAASGINNVTGSVVEIRAGGLFGGAGEIGTMNNPISIATPAASGRNVYLIVPAVNGIQTTTPSISYSGSSASLLLKGYTGTTGFLFFDLSSTFSPETILSGDETIVPLANGRVAVNSDSLSAAKQALSSGVITRVNVDWAAFDPNVSLFGTLDPSLRLPADQIDEEVPTASLIPEGTMLSVTRDGWELKRAM